MRFLRIYWHLRKAGFSRFQAEAVKNLTRDVNQAKIYVRIFTGEGSCLIYSHPRFIKAAIRAHKRRGVVIEASIGPFMSVLDMNGKRFNGLVYLAARGIAKLYYRSKRTAIPHFRVTDKPSVRREEYHSVAAGPDERVQIQIPRESIPECAKEDNTRFEEMLRSASVDGAEVRLSEHPQDDFIPLTDQELKVLLALSERKGENLDEFTKEDIENHLGELRYMILERDISWTRESRASTCPKGKVKLIKERLKKGVQKMGTVALTVLGLILSVATVVLGIKMLLSSGPSSWFELLVLLAFAVTIEISMLITTRGRHTISRKG